jgi:mycothione reductase
VRVGTARYSDVAQGEAMMETAGFAKGIVDDETDKILGFHVVGPYAPILVQEVTAAMANGGDLGFVFGGMHIHPAITELVPRVFSELR